MVEPSLDELALYGAASRSALVWQGTDKCSLVNFIAALV